MTRAALLAAVLLTGIAGPLAARAAEHGVYVLNTSTGAPYSTPQQSGFLDRVVAEAFSRLGLKGRVALYEASKRALINANDDVDQGVAMRIKNLDKNFPNLVRVDEPVIVNDFVAYSRGGDVATTGWAALKPYAVTHIHGWVIFERNLPAGQSVTTVREAQQMFTLLQKGRADMALYERWQGLRLAKDQGLEVRVHEPPLASVDMFMYVHKNHAELAGPLAAALKAMKADGTYQAIFDETLTPLLPAADR